MDRPTMVPTMRINAQSGRARCGMGFTRSDRGIEGSSELATPALPVANTSWQVHRHCDVNGDTGKARPAIPVAASLATTGALGRIKRAHALASSLSHLLHIQVFATRLLLFRQSLDNVIERGVEGGGLGSAERLLK